MSKNKNFKNVATGQTKRFFCKSSCALTHEVPLSVGDVSGDISLDHLQVQRPAAVRPRAELQVAALHIERKPANVDVTGALKYSWSKDSGKEWKGKSKDKTCGGEEKLGAVWENAQKQGQQ